jgi:hypothetical protein
MAFAVKLLKARDRVDEKDKRNSQNNVPSFVWELSFFSFGCGARTIERNKGEREKYYKFFLFDLLSKKFAEKSFMQCSWREYFLLSQPI